MHTEYAMISIKIQYKSQYICNMHIATLKLQRPQAQHVAVVPEFLDDGGGVHDASWLILVL